MRHMPSLPPMHPKQSVQPVQPVQIMKQWRPPRSTKELRALSYLQPCLCNWDGCMEEVIPAEMEIIPHLAYQHHVDFRQGSIICRYLLNSGMPCGKEMRFDSLPLHIVGHNGHMTCKSVCSACNAVFLGPEECERHHGLSCLACMICRASFEEVQARRRHEAVCGQ